MRVSFNAPSYAQRVINAALAPIIQQLGQLYYQTTPPTGLYVADSPTTWNRVEYLNYYNVKSYGAAGDGIADDRAAVQAAIAAIPASGGTVFFPSGVYNIAGGDLTIASRYTRLLSENVTLNLGANRIIVPSGMDGFSITGPGPWGQFAAGFASFSLESTGVGPVLDIGDAAALTNYLRVSDVCIRSNAANATLMRLRQTVLMDIERLNLRAFGANTTGVLIDATPVYCGFIRFLNMICQECQTGIRTIGSCTSSQIIGGNIGRTPGGVGDIAIHLQDTSNCWVFLGVDIEGYSTGLYCLTADNWGWLRFETCTLDINLRGVSSNNLFFTSNGANPTVTNIGTHNMVIGRGFRLAVQLPVYVNNAAAIAGGLTAGDLYRNNADPDHVMIVH
jgi:hypothetical protein